MDVMQVGIKFEAPAMGQGRSRKVVVASSLDPFAAACVDHLGAQQRRTTSSVIRDAVHYYLRVYGYGVEAIDPVALMNPSDEEAEDILDDEDTSSEVEQVAE